jgi:nicotinamidase-related amidase
VEIAMTPLLRPADCCVLLVDPRARYIDHLDAARQAELARCLKLVGDAARACAVPVHLAFVGGVPEPHDWTSPLSSVPPTHALGTEGASWSRSGLDKALPAQRRSSLILAGFWLETTVTFLALPALAAGFEVFVAMDASPAWEDTAARPAADRLLQAGAVPLTTHQLMAEWMEVSDPVVRATLSPLLPTE